MQIVSKFLLILISLLVLLNSCSNTVNPTDQDGNTALIASLDKLGDSLTSKIIKNGKNVSIPGVIIGVSHPNSNFTYLKSFGKADLSKNTSLFRNDEIRIGTITQSFVATLTMIMVNHGQISLDDAISKYLQLPHSSTNIRIAHLLNHKSGIADFTDSVKFYQLSDPKKKFSNNELINFAFSQSESFKPVSTPKYSNTNYLILSMIIEKITGEKMQNLIKNKILEPLNLNNTNFEINSSFKSNLFSNGYIYSDSTGFVDYTKLYDYSWASGSSNMTSNALDIMAWTETLVDGKLINSATQNTMQTFDKLSSKGNIDLYLGMGVMKIGSFQGYSSEFDGYYCSTYYLPGNKTKIFVFTNSQNNNDQLMIHIANLIFPGIKAN